MKRTASTPACLVVAAALLAGCAQGAPPATVPVSDELDSTGGSPSGPAAPAAATVGTGIRDCPDAARRWAEAERAPGTGDDWPAPGRVVETSSGTVLETIVGTFGAGVPTPSPRPLARMTPDPAWPRDSVVVIDDSTGTVVDTIHVGDDSLCAP